MVGAQHSDVLRSLGLVSRASRRHVALPLSWNTLLKHGKGKDLAMMLTLLGAGSMGAFIAMRYAFKTPVALTFSWTDNKKASADVKNKADPELTIAGLQNMGNNCFLNVVLQALASSDVLVSFMEECAGVIDTQGVQAERTTMPLAAAVADLLRELAQGQIARRILSPRKVMLALNLYSRQFDLSMQQDAAEALAYLAAGLQEERDKYLNLHRPVSQSFGSVLDMNLATPQLDQSLLHWPLEGTLGSLMTCQRCDFQFSTVFQYFNDISLPLSRRTDGSIIDNCTLEDCLDRFTAPEWVASVKCSHCAHMEASKVLRSQMDNTDLTTDQEQLDVHIIQEKIKIIEDCSCDDDCSCEALVLKQGGVWNSVRTNASKRLRIGRSPEVLCLQVQRAVVNEVGELRKLSGHVRFPMILDLFPYTVASQENKVRMIDTRTEDHGKSSIRMLGQRGVVFSHIRKLQGPGYSSLLFPLERGIKGGSKSSTQTDDVLSTTESADARVTTEDVVTDTVSDESLVLEDSLADLAAMNNQAITKNKEARDLTHQETPNSDGTSMVDISDASSSETITSSTPGCSGLDRHSIQVSGSIRPQNAQAERTLTSRKLLYELLSIVVHHGGPHSGHYTVYRKVRLPKSRDSKVKSAEEDCAGLLCHTEVREHSEKVEIDATVTSRVLEQLQDGRERLREATEEGNARDEEIVLWFKVSDSNVRRVEELEVLLANASLLFYERLTNS
ncbi:uncharacterized protein [Physcomitrium patens]|uniref:Ubiquitin carboxyl-terminal hydrolase n=1 Tax=Physcomitrium patens TaxID=3218 RepID=A0A2K1J1I7_PHYPA|nr:uncharacterized protein LOC112295611 [Physcomitrium patens]XP_024403187.1 uncharacterized protein LOC112295611 [Physcomitrium patens]XP_024403188.1 uncharacterized protein LOC112295611 [Physcomitrium patens]PNR35390.1 hypothetical protein PHYPA_023290 [Physcomitrium patens]|eukprot:XP_024403186.1 uncharacterized protein LOC112295611 [Physcomitrella patens]